MDRQTVFDYIKKKYKVLPEYPWRKYGGSAVFRHSDNSKWFALVMDVQGDKVGLSGDLVDRSIRRWMICFSRYDSFSEDDFMPWRI